MTLLDRLFELMDERGLNPSKVTRDLNISVSSFTDWKKGKGSPSLDVTNRLADYFGVSLDFLVNGKSGSASNVLDFSNVREKRLVEKFRLLPLELQDRLFIYIDGMLAVSSEPKKKGRKSSV